MLRNIPPMAEWTPTAHRASLVCSGHRAELVRFKLHLATLSQSERKKQSKKDCFFSLVAVVALCFMTFEVMSSRSQSDLRANNLQPKLKQPGVVLTTVDTAEQGVGRAECTEAIGDDYANGAVGHDTSANR